MQEGALTRHDRRDADAELGKSRASLLAVTLMAGCATATSKLPAPRVTVPLGWQQTADSANVAVSESPEDISRWWLQLDDTTLSDLIARALAANPDLRSAVSAAQADMEASEADLHDTQVSLVAELALNYLELRASQARLAIARANLARQAETLELTSWRAQAGLTSELDVEQSRANVEQTRALVPSLETSMTEAEHRVAILLGQPPAALHDTLAAPSPIPAAPERVVVGIPADTLRQRPDVRAAERRVAAEPARLNQAKAARYPSFKLSGSIGIESLSLGGLMTGDTVIRSLLGSVTGPLFDRGRIRRQIEIQGASQEQTLAAYERTILTAFEEVENALVTLANARRRQTALSAAAEAARNAAQLAQSRYIAGLTSYQPVLDTERSVLSIEDNLKSTEAEGTSALIRLYKALGGGWAPDTNEANSEESRARHLFHRMTSWPESWPKV